MTTWHRDGTVDVTNGSTTVTGTGTNFNGAVRVGDAAHLPDGRSYEITGVVSDTEITIATGYLGSTATGQDYAVQPTRGIRPRRHDLWQGFAQWGFRAWDR